VNEAILPPLPPPPPPQPVGTITIPRQFLVKAGILLDQPHDFLLDWVPNIFCGGFRILLFSVWVSIDWNLVSPRHDVYQPPKP